MECISLCGIPCLYTLSASAFIDSSLHQLDFFLEIFLWRLVTTTNEMNGQNISFFATAPSNDPCTPNPCQNGGRCSTSGGSSRAECACINSWRGPNCTQCAVPNCAQCSQSREGCGTCDHGYTLQDNTGQCGK